MQTLGHHGSSTEETRSVPGTKNTNLQVFRLPTAGVYHFSYTGTLGFLEFILHPVAKYS